MKYIAKILLSIVCVVVIVFAYRWGAANVFYFKVTNKLNSYTDTAVFQIADDEGLEANIKTMMALHPNHPHYMVTAGTYFEKRAFVESDAKQKKAYLLKALALYRASAEQRIAWPRTWADIFRVKAKLGEFDSEFSHAVSMANNYGSKDEYVAKEIVFLLLKHWRDFSKSDIEIAIKQMNNVTDYARFKNVYDYALVIGEKTFFCNLVRINNIQTRFGGCKA